MTIKEKIEAEDIAKIVQSDILFAVQSGDLAKERGGCKIIGSLPLDARHQIQPKYFHPDMINIGIVDFTISQVKQTMKYKTFETAGVQDGGIYSADHIKERLKNYFEGKDYIGSLVLLDALENLKASGWQSQN